MELTEQELIRIKGLDFDVPKTPEEIKMVRKFLNALPDLEETEDSLDNPASKPV